MTAKLPPITIVIPFYNAEETLLDAVRSVFAQTHEDWELILLDDGSTDGSLEMAKSISDSRVRVYSDGQNKKLAARLNQIPGLASYGYLARMDADDLMSSTRIERQLAFLLSHPELDLVSTGICSLTDDNEPTGVRSAIGGHTMTSRQVLAGKSGIVHASLVGTREWFSRNKYRENMRTAQDANLWIRALSNDDLRIGFIAEQLYYYREDGNVVSNKIIRAYRAGLKTILLDSGSSYSVLDKSYAFSVTLAKLFVAQVLSSTGSHGWLRKRRNGQVLSEDETESFLAEIEYIRNIRLPFI